MPRAVREQQMLDAAVRTFAQRGYRKASMDDIAERAGVSKPLVYLYLHSKEELFRSCIRRESAALVAAVTASIETGAPPDRQLWSGLQGFFRHTAEHPDGWTLLHVQARTHGRAFAREVAALRTEIVDLVTRLIAAAVRDSGTATESPLVAQEVSGLAHALVGAAESLADWAGGGRSGPTARETAATLMNFAWAGLERLMRGERWSADAADAADAVDAAAAAAAADEELERR
ncbi:TetR/AcrR family transcriptional regulator [Streptomyces sp. B1866]|uniref:TetR/AcrR family transcriptional regulator n=1 Tax=Streptomyces sp. B1866 TaxID=3075431 RepID=UPI00288EC829|nr:TetR/AcrR family transcriptional regulator [Streptomyces sp. B1866]MDT3398620.1 TetR/AcrR family transcriptional regulator [Streptomyces sp. B1866]